MSDGLPSSDELFVNAKQPTFADSMDRYRGFRRVFLSDDAGKRVLDELLSMCRFHERTATKGDAMETYFREGQRSIALSLLGILYVEPVEPPQRQKTLEE